MTHGRRITHDDDAEDGSSRPHKRWAVLCPAYARLRKTFPRDALLCSRDLRTVAGVVTTFSPIHSNQIGETVVGLTDWIGRLVMTID